MAVTPFKYKQKRRFREYDQIGKEIRIQGFAERQMGKSEYDYNFEDCAVSYVYWLEGWQMADRLLNNKLMIGLA